MSKTINQGWIKEDEYGSLVLVADKDKSYDGEPIAEIFEDFNDKKISVRYYISDKAVTEDEALEASITKDLGGDVKAEFILDAYSEWTIMEHKQEAIVGGHDLLDELETYEGKYCTLIIEVQA